MAKCHLRLPGGFAVGIIAIADDQAAIGDNVQPPGGYQVSLGRRFVASWPARLAAGHDQIKQIAGTQTHELGRRGIIADQRCFSTLPAKGGNFG
jgi:hypothetical protein